MKVWLLNLGLTGALIGLLALRAPTWLILGVAFGWPVYLAMFIWWDGRPPRRGITSR